MPVLGFFLGATFAELVTSIDHWIAFILLLLIGVGMIRESFDDEVEKRNDKVDFKTMVILAIATSIDALAVGIVFAAEKTDLLFSVTMIGVITFALSLAGVFTGHKFGSKYEKKAEIAGGIILILLGLKLLLEGLGVL